MSANPVARRYADDNTVYWLTNGWGSRHHAVIDIKDHGIMKMPGLRLEHRVITGQNSHGFKGWIVRWGESGHPLVVFSVAYLPTRRKAVTNVMRLLVGEIITDSSLGSSV